MMFLFQNRGFNSDKTLFTHFSGRMEIKVYREAGRTLGQLLLDEIVTVMMKNATLRFWTRVLVSGFRCRLMLPTDFCRA